MRSLDVWSEDPVCALRAVAAARTRPELDAAMFVAGPLTYEAALPLAQPIVLPQLVPTVAACLGWSIADVERVARGSGVVDGAVDDDPEDALGPATLVPLLAASQAPAANALREAGLSPEALVVDVLPVPGDREVPAASLDGLVVPSRIHAAYHHLALVDAIANRLDELRAPAILRAYEVWKLERCAREILRAVRDEPYGWEPVDFDEIARVMRERLAGVDAPPEWIDRYAPGALTAPVVPSRGMWPPRRPMTPIAVCFVAGGCLIAFPYALAHLELPSGRVRALHASGDLRFNAVSEDGRFVQCVLGDALTREWWPELSVYSVDEARWITAMPPGLPSTVFATLHDTKELEVFELARRARRAVAFETTGDTRACIATSPDGRFAWRRMGLDLDQRGIIEVATDRSVFRPVPFEPRPPCDDEADEADDDSPRALVKLAGGGFRLFCEGHLRDGELERFRAREVRAAAFSSDGKRLALVHRHALRIVDLGPDGVPARELRVDLLPLRGLLTLDRFWDKASWTSPEDMLLAATHTIPELRACADAEAVLAKFDVTAPSLDDCEELWAVARAVSVDLPVLPTSECAPTTEPPPALLLGERALFTTLPRWVAAGDTTARELALRYLTEGAELLDREVNDDDAWTHVGVHEWVLRGTHGRVHVIGHADTNAVAVVAEEGRDLALLGDEPPLEDDDDLIRWALIDPDRVELDSFIDAWEHDDEADGPGVVWTTALVGSAAQQERVLAIAQAELHASNRAWIEQVLETARDLRASD